jgi:SAM-dependent methyltransferase
MQAEQTEPLNGRDSAAKNRTFYDALWAQAYVERPERFNTWPLISGLLPAAPVRLEIGPGLRPRLPIAGTHFVDLSQPVIERLKAGGGIAMPGEICTLPFADGTFDLVCAFDVIEHVEEDRRAFGELSRVLKDDGTLIFSVPVHDHLWTEFDEWVGHVRRYNPPDLLAMIADHQLVPERSAAFGMQPTNPRLLKFGMWCLKHRRTEAMWFYNRLFMPLGMFLQKRLEFVEGLLDTNGVDEVVLVCRRRSR